jgi:hypothetical protein
MIFASQAFLHALSLAASKRITGSKKRKMDWFDGGDAVLTIEGAAHMLKGASFCLESRIGRQLMKIARCKDEARLQDARRCFDATLAMMYNNPSKGHHKAKETITTMETSALFQATAMGILSLRPDELDAGKP